MHLKEFSLDAFQNLNSPEEKAKMANRLKERLENEIHRRVFPKVEEMVAQLNSMGHHLRPYDVIQPGDYSYRDDNLEDEGKVLADRYACKLRLYVDFCIDSGFADTNSFDY